MVPLPEVCPLMSVLELTKPDTYINIKIYLYREIDIHICMHIYAHTHILNRLYEPRFLDRFQLNKSRRATKRMSNHIYLYVYMNIILYVIYICIIYIMNIYKNK